MAIEQEHVFKVETDDLEYTFGACSHAAQSSPDGPGNLTLRSDKCNGRTQTPASAGKSTPRSMCSDQSFDFTFGPGGHPCAQMENTPVENTIPTPATTTPIPVLVKAEVREAQHSDFTTLPSTDSLSFADTPSMPQSHYSRKVAADTDPSHHIQPVAEVPEPPSGYDEQGQYAQPDQRQYTQEEYDYAVAQAQYEVAKAEYEAAQLQGEAEVYRGNAPEEVPSSTCCMVM